MSLEEYRNPHVWHGAVRLRSYPVSRVHTSEYATGQFLPHQRPKGSTGTHRSGDRPSSARAAVRLPIRMSLAQLQSRPSIATCSLRGISNSQKWLQSSLELSRGRKRRWQRNSAPELELEREPPWPIGDGDTGTSVNLTTPAAEIDEVTRPRPSPRIECEPPRSGRARER